MIVKEEHSGDYSEVVSRMGSVSAGTGHRKCFPRHSQSGFEFLYGLHGHLVFSSYSWFIRHGVLRTTILFENWKKNPFKELIEFYMNF